MTSRQNLFSRLTKYRGLYHADPGEDRLTEAFAGLLESVDCALAVHLVRAWLDADEASIKVGFGERAGKGEHLTTEHLEEVIQVKVRTQVPLKGRFVDLQLEFFGEDATSRNANMIRLELKRGTEPHGGQVRHYEARLDDKPTVPVVILAPAEQLTFDNPYEAPETAPQRSWQHTYGLIKDFSFLSDGLPEGARDQWLKDEFCEYLEEEGLMPMKRLDDEHLIALGVLDEAQNGLSEILRYARKKIEQDLGAPTKGEHEGIRSWRHYDIGVDLPPGVWVEFKASDERFSSELLGARAGVKFIAGLGWKGDALPDGFPESAASALEGRDFHHFTENKCGRLMRVLLPNDAGFSGARTLEAQGDFLAEWVSQCLAQIRSELVRSV